MDTSIQETHSCHFWMFTQQETQTYVPLPCWARVANNKTALLLLLRATEIPPPCSVTRCAFHQSQIWAQLQLSAAIRKKLLYTKLTSLYQVSLKNRTNIQSIFLFIQTRFTATNTLTGQSPRTTRSETAWIALACWYHQELKASVSPQRLLSVRV